MTTSRVEDSRNSRSKSDVAPFLPVEFRSEGVALRGHLYVPPHRSEPAPAVIMAHGFSATIQGMVADKYAEVFHEGGFAVLLYDHRNFGLSDGEPRQEINRWVQARGYCAALDFMGARGEVDPDRIALWGDSASAGEVLAVGSVDKRAKAVIAQVPACSDEPPPPDPGGSLFSSLKGTLLRGDVTSDSEKTVGPMPVVSADQLRAPSLLTPLTAFRWFIEYGGRFGTLWENWATVGGPATRVPFHPALCTPYLEVPLLMMAARQDEMPGASERISKIAFEYAAGHKELIEVEGGHFGLLDYPGEVFDGASRAQVKFLKRRLR